MKSNRFRLVMLVILAISAIVFSGCAGTPAPLTATGGGGTGHRSRLPNPEERSGKYRRATEYHRQIEGDHRSDEGSLDPPDFSRRQDHPAHAGIPQGHQLGQAPRASYGR